jgi:hypothetical protein
MQLKLSNGKSEREVTIKGKPSMACNASIKANPLL